MYITIIGLKFGVTLIEVLYLEGGMIGEGLLYHVYGQKLFYKCWIVQYISLLMFAKSS